MNRFWATALVLGALVGTSVGPVAILEASTVQGTAVQISGLDDLAATADQQARKGGGKVLAMALGVGGLIGVASGHHYIGAMGVGSGVATAFIPSMMSSAFDNAPAATSLAVEHVASGAWWAPATALLYPVFLLARFLQDPVVLVACVLALVAVRRVRPVVA
jgi:hypothetical protein